MNRRKLIPLSVLILAMPIVQARNQQPLFRVNNETREPREVPGEFCAPVPSALINQLKAIKIRKKVSIRDATTIAECYFSHRFGLCGSLNQPKAGIENVSFSFAIGYTATPSAVPIVVDRSTGGVSCGNSERFSSIQEFSEHLSLLEK